MISEKYNFIFFHVPKAAGSSISKALNESLRNDVLANDKNNAFKKFLSQKGRIWHNHATSEEVKEYLGNELYQSYFKFCFVRNPFDRLVSLYHYTKQKEVIIYKKNKLKLPKFSKQIIDAGSFENWIKAGNLGSTQTKFLSDNKGEFLVDFVGRSENLQADFSYICGVLGIQNTILPQVNVSKHDDFKKYYNEDTKEIVSNWFKKDLELFDYNFVSNDSYKPLKLNNRNLKKRLKPFIKLIEYKNKNKFCRFSVDKLTNIDNIVLHPNEIGSSPLELKFLIQGNRPVKRLSFNCISKNKNPLNCGVLLYCEILDEKQKFVHSINERLLPLKLTNICINLDSKPKSYIVLKLNSVPEAKSHFYSGVRLKNFVLN